MKLQVVLDEYSVDWPRIVARINQPPEQEVDVALVLPNGTPVLVHLEDAPQDVVDLDPANPPDWAGFV